MSKEQMSFEEASKRLEEIVSQLENGCINLDDSLNLFSEGVHLIKFCNHKLDEAEQKVRILTDDGSGHMIESEFN